MNNHTSNPPSRTYNNNGPHSDDEELVKELLAHPVSQIGEDATTEGYITDEDLSNLADSFSDSEWQASQAELNIVPTRDQQSVSATSSEGNHRTAFQEANHNDIQVFDPPARFSMYQHTQNFCTIDTVFTKARQKRYLVPLELNRQIFGQ